MDTITLVSNEFQPVVFYEARKHRMAIVAFGNIRLGVFFHIYYGHVSLSCLWGCEMSRETFAVILEFTRQAISAGTIDKGFLDGDSLWVRSHDSNEDAEMFLPRMGRNERSGKGEMAQLSIAIAKLIDPVWQTHIRRHINVHDGIVGLHEKVYGDFANIHGDVSGVVGDISNLRGKVWKELNADVTNLWGDCSGVYGDAIGLSLTGNVTGMVGRIEWHLILMR